MQMLRVKHFSLQTELLLLPCKTEMLAFVKPAGHIETLAKQEFNYYADNKRLVGQQLGLCYLHLWFVLHCCTCRPSLLVMVAFHAMHAPLVLWLVLLLPGAK